MVSAKYGTGLEELKNVLEEFIREDHILVERLIPYQEAGLIQLIRKSGQLLEEKYEPEGIWIRAYVPMELYGKL